MGRDWHEWHRAYDHPDSPLARRLAVVQGFIRDELDARPQGPIRIVSMCAGEGRDILGVLADHPRRRDAHGRLVELDPDLVAIAREQAPATIEIVCGDAAVTDMYEGAVPADLILVCGVFGNISDDDVANTIAALPMFCAPDATVIWTRHRRAPDATPAVRKQFAEAGFDEIAFVASDGMAYGVGAHRFAGRPQPFLAHRRLFEFGALERRPDSCPQCGFTYAMERAEVVPWLRSDTAAFVDRFRAIGPDDARRRPAADVWSPLEYACHVRDVLRVQRERVLLTQVEDEPAFAPMRRDERAVEERYNDQDPAVVATEIEEAGTAFIATLEALDDIGWSRTGIYNYPAPQPRTVEWIAIHTVHELLHHRVDIGTLA